MRSVQEYCYRLPHFLEVELIFNREMQEASVSRIDYKVVFGEKHTLKDEKIQNSTKCVQDAF